MSSIDPTITLTTRPAMTAAPQSVCPRAAGAARRGKAGRAPWAVADQVLISGTNFVTMVLLARGLSQADFGTFTLLYSVLLFGNSMQSGLVTQPHNVLGASRRGEEYAGYTAATTASQLVLATVGSLAVFVAWGVGAAAGWPAAELLPALAVSVLAWQVQEFIRRVLYTEGRVVAAFVNDLLSYGGQAALVVALWWTDRLTGALALYALAATSGAAVVVGAWQVRGSVGRSIDRAAFRENWDFGKWLAGGEIVGYWLSTQLFVYLTAGMLGAAAVGVLRAIHTLFGPTRIIAYVFSTVLPIRLSRARADGGDDAMRDQLRRAYRLGVPALAAYCILVALLAGPLLRLLYGDKYAGHADVLAVYSGAMFVSFVGMITAAALRARRLTRGVFTSRLCATLVSIPVGWLSIHAFGLPGAVVGMAATYLALNVMFWRAYRRGDANEPAPALPR